MDCEAAPDDRAKKGSGPLNGVVPGAAIDPVEIADEAMLLHSEHDRTISGGALGFNISYRV